MAKPKEPLRIKYNYDPIRNVYIIEPSILFLMFNNMKKIGVDEYIKKSNKVVLPVDNDA